MQTKRPPGAAARLKNKASLPDSSTALPRVTPRATRPRKSAKAKKQGEE
jgi:hypothetical protein